MKSDRFNACVYMLFHDKLLLLFFCNPHLKSCVANSFLFLNIFGNNYLIQISVYGTLSDSRLRASFLISSSFSLP